MNWLIPQFRDMVDIVIIAFLIYQALSIVRKSGGYQLLTGILLLFLLYLASVLVNLKMLSAVLGAVRNYWILALIILFQPEIRSMLARFNLSQDMGIFKKRENTNVFTTLVDAVSSMSFRKTGALIVVENKRKLNEYIQNGEPIDASISLRLILTIFNPRSSLHDGAIIIRGDRILAAKVVLPLTKKSEYVKRFGTRHLAGIGISELTDAIAIIVSEQNGHVSIAQGGVIQNNVAFEELMQIVSDAAG
ncbi:MAG: diadenylate cyclase CdaA [Candidatus Cloacimonetes bacterium]|nr:diadenylate cyclase CdaA [Candidatus Cloacimonadota bacterium]HNZ06257.1 diadenylate cyclase CdaA [Candidatus Cloacimonadota bacterium]HOH78165.1 diadenylate cyclase CdaA [Candidatus Cloacimonadota bacterium]